MYIYSLYVLPNHLISPINGYICRRITKQNIKQFGYCSVEELHAQYPEFPLMCSDYQTSIGKDPKGLRQRGIDKRTIHLKELKTKQKSEERILYNKAPKKCEKCDTQIPFEMKSNKFCSRICANGRPKSIETRKKISILAKERQKPERNPHNFSNCIICETKIFKRKHKTCSKECYAQYRKNSSSSKDLLVSYRKQCSFQFNVYNFPDEFDLLLVEIYGWYAASNRGNNLNGISRDHIVSVKYGFDNNIDPSIISHPANCQLMPHSKNSSKGIVCGISIYELLRQIEEWNKKYPIILEHGEVESPSSVCRTDILPLN